MKLLDTKYTVHCCRGVAGFLIVEVKQLASHTYQRAVSQVQDTIVVCPNQLAQQVALASLEHGDSYLEEQIAGLAHNRSLLADALSPLGSKGHGWVGGEGAIYYWARLPPQFAAQVSDAFHTGSGGQSMQSPSVDDKVVEWLIKKHGVCIIPGSSCGAPGYVRVAFANLKPQQCEAAAERLKAGLQQLVSLDASDLA